MNLETVHQNYEVIKAKAEVNKLVNWLAENRKGLSVDWDVYPLLEAAIAGDDIEDVAISITMNYYPYWKSCYYQLVFVELPNLAKVRQINQVIESGAFEPSKITQKIVRDYKAKDSETHRV